MDRHLKNVRGAGSSRLIFIIVGILNGAIPVLIGYILKSLGT